MHVVKEKLIRLSETLRVFLHSHNLIALGNFLYQSHAACFIAMSSVLKVKTECGLSFGMWNTTNINT